MFNHLVIIEKINMLNHEIEELSNYARLVTYYPDVPGDDDEIIKRIDDADAILLSYTSKIDRYVLENVKNVKYIGMCCSLYSKESANVDIDFAEKKNICVKGIRDYGDRGVAEYVIHELTEFLEGYHGLKWDTMPREIKDLKCGVIGLGTSGTLIARTLKFFEADVSYYSRTRKEDLEREYGFKYKSLNEVCKDSEAIFLALNKNVLLLDDEQFNLMKGKRILFNTSIGPGFSTSAFEKWIKADKNHFFFGDTLATIGDPVLWNLPNTKTIRRSAGGGTYQAFKLLGEKVINNIKEYLEEEQK